MAYRPNVFDTRYETPFGYVDNAGRDIASLNYILYIVGFFTGITALVGVLLAYSRRRRVGAVARSHLEWQIRIFWHCVLAWIAIGVLHAVIAGLGAVTFGFGLVFMVIPWGLGVIWLVWTIWAIVTGMRHLNRNMPIG